MRLKYVPVIVLTMTLAGAACATKADIERLEGRLAEIRASGNALDDWVINQLYPWMDNIREAIELIQGDPPGTPPPPPDGGW